MSDWDQCRQRLEDRLVQLRAVADSARDAAAAVELDQTRVGRLSRMDAMQAQAMSQASNQRREAEIRHILAALRRIEQGEYGECLRCGGPIAAARLDYDPAVTTCIDCASAAQD